MDHLDPPKLRDGIDQLLSLTVRIRSYDNEADEFDVGTGFCWEFDRERLGTAVPLIVTNKHVIEGSDVLFFDFALRDKEGYRAYSPGIRVKVPASALPTIPHPDNKVDLAAVYASPLMNAIQKEGHKHCVISHSGHAFMESEVKQEIPNFGRLLQSVVMVGFPDGLMDEKNNLPIVRKGNLSTPLEVDYAGAPDLLVDIPAFKGSSGSPVFLMVEAGPYQNHKGELKVLSRPLCELVGILHSTHVRTVEGDIKQRPIPTSSREDTKTVAELRSELNLGVCHKASLLDDFLPIVEEHLKVGVKFATDDFAVIKL